MARAPRKTTRQRKPKTPPHNSHENIARGLVVITMLLLLFALLWLAHPWANRPPAPAPALTPTPWPAVLPTDTPIPVNEATMTAVDFTGVSAKKKAEVIAQFEKVMCGCGCMMSVAQCIVRDLKCPMWNDHVMEFQKALGNGKTPHLKPTPTSLPAPAPNS